MDHRLPAIIHDRNLHWKFVLGNTVQLIAGHVKRAIAINDNTSFVRESKLGPNCEGQADTHCPQRSRGQNLPGLGPAIELTRHHLMVAYPSGHKRLEVLAVVIDVVDNLLGLNQATLVLLIAEGAAFSPFIDLVYPLCSCIVLHQRDQILHRRHAITDHRKVRLDDLANLAWFNIKMNDSTTLLCRSFFSLRCILGNHSSSTIIKSVPNTNDQVRRLHCKIRIRCPMHPQHLQAERVCLIKHSHSMK
mmetsp:Transcript_114146/g.198416  ORF Transcript_114146/g.198416 Transcript_114146/m.198416 type:complete len:247 (+) Transcript_114146:839-1579(+)